MSCSCFSENPAAFVVPRECDETGRLAVAKHGNRRHRSIFPLADEVHAPVVGIGEYILDMHDPLSSRARPVVESRPGRSGKLC
jgi:hypothetical protein